MSNAYLELAERILRATRKPMRPKEIIEQALLDRALPSHLYGHRQDRTLQARLSEDIAKYREQSRFLRTAPGIFSIRERAFLGGSTNKSLGEYLAKPRRKELPQKDILCLKFEDDHFLEGDDIISLDRFYTCLDKGDYFYSSSKDLSNDNSIAAVYSFVVVHREEQVLSFRCGKFFPESDPLFGKRSIGVGGVVLSTDVDMLYDSVFGIVGSGISELGYGIGLPRNLSERARYNNELRPCIGIVASNSRGNPCIHVVMTYACPEDFVPTKHSLSVNDLKWLDLRSPINNIDDYDQTSQHLLRTELGNYLKREIST